MNDFQSDALVFFGATGDLAHKKIFPALQAMIRFGFERMEMHRIEAQVEPPNEASKAVLRRLGFKEEGVARERGHWHGVYHDLAQFGLLQSDFEAASRGE